jgi:hypothetical protein
MASTTTNDNKIKELKTQIQDKLDNITKISKDFKTNMILEFRDNTYNLNVLPANALQERLIQLYLYQTAIDALNITDYTIAGYPVEDWIYDIQKLLEIYEQNKKIKDLKANLAKLDALMSDAARTEEFLDDLAEMLKD